MTNNKDTIYTQEKKSLRKITILTMRLYIPILMIKSQLLFSDILQHFKFNLVSFINKPTVLRERPAETMNRLKLEIKYFKAINTEE